MQLPDFLKNIAAIDLTEALGRFVGIEDLTDIGEGYAVFLSSIIVVLGWYVSRRGQINSERSRHTSEWIRVLKQPKTQERVKALSTYVVKGQPTPCDPALLTKEQKQALSDLLADAEEQSVAVRLGVISETYVDQTERQFLQYAFIIASPYIHSVRQSLSAKTHYQNIEIYFIRSYIRKAGLIYRVLNIVCAHPPYRYSLFLFKLRYRMCRMLDPTMHEDYLLNSWPDTRARMRRLRRLRYLLLSLSFAAFYIAFVA